MTEYHTSSFNETLEIFNQFKEPKGFLFRGQSNYEWSLIPKAGRPEFANSYSSSCTEEDLYEAWKRYAVQFLKTVPESNLDWYALAQHHGFATRLLDWSKNPLTALYFSADNSFENDGAIYVIPHYKNYAVTNSQKIDPFNITGTKVILPKSISPRIVNQRGVFTISNKPSISLEKQLIDDRVFKIKIKKEAKKEILDTLEFYGINQLSLFHNLDSLSSYLNSYGKIIGNKSSFDIENF